MILTHRKILYILPLMLVFLTSCLPVEEEVLPPPLVEAVRMSEYSTVPVERGDVQNDRTVAVYIVASREVELAFSVDNLLLTGIYVQEGDYVREGDIIADLDRSRTTNELDSIARDTVWLELGLRQMEERYDFDVARDGTAGFKIDEGTYTVARGAFAMRLETNRLRSTHLDYENSLRVLYAPMDGIVTFAIEFIEGTFPTAGRHIATIADRSSQVLVLRGNDARLVDVGDMLEISLGGVMYSGIVTDPSELEISRPDSESEKYIVILDDDVAIFQNVATAYIVIEKSVDTLFVPSSAVKKVGERVFVYVFTTDGVRTVRDIEIGVEGRREVEVLSGLNEGELVIIS